MFSNSNKHSVTQAKKVKKAKKVNVKSKFNSLLVDLTLLTGSTLVHPMDDIPGRQLNTVLIKAGFLDWIGPLPVL
jgi:hypothetical protein